MEVLFRVLSFLQGRLLWAIVDEIGAIKLDPICSYERDGGWNLCSAHTPSDLFPFLLVVCFPFQQPAPASLCSLLEDHPQAAQIHLPAILGKPDDSGKDSLPLELALSNNWQIKESKCLGSFGACWSESYSSASHTFMLMWIGWGWNSEADYAEGGLRVSNSNKLPGETNAVIHRRLFQQHRSLFRAPSVGSNQGQQQDANASHREQE